MTQSHATFKSFEPRTGHTPCRLPTLIDRLAGGVALPGHFELEDLREMSKFLEIPNVYGVAAYPIERPAPPGFDPARPRGPERADQGAPEAGALAPIAELPAGVERPLAHRLETEPIALARGRIGSAGAGMLVQAIVPQSHAHLAAALKLMLHPWPANDEGEISAAGYTILVWPAALATRRGPPLEELIGHWPEPGREGQGTGLIIGCDDPGLIAAMIEDAARRKGVAIDRDAAWARPLARAEELAKTEEGRARALNVETWLYGVETDGDGHFPFFEDGSDCKLGWALAGRSS